MRAIRVMVDAALKESSWRFDAVYATSGRPSIAQEERQRALLLQVVYTVRSERLLMEQLDYNFLFRWFVGLNIDDPVWDVTAVKCADLSGEIMAAPGQTPNQMRSREGAR